MKRPRLDNLLERVSLRSLKAMISARERLDSLEKRRGDLREELDAVNRQIESVLRSVRGGPGRPETARAVGDAGKRDARRRGTAASLSALVAGVLREKNKPMTVYEICGVLLNEKGYGTDLPDFDSRVRAVLEENAGVLFSRTLSGQYILTKR